jgi:hypothetical protein
MRYLFFVKFWADVAYSRPLLPAVGLRRIAFLVGTHNGRLAALVEPARERRDSAIVD